ncbi:MAG: S24/S26 family peptidase [Ruminococcus sp.]|nr:S24/S26 family peptidase [Ruminococcus sp.]MBR1385162.1 S24/S26 family peptidase [Ruminococcus sp.]
MGQIQFDMLERDGRYISVPQGISMRPMIRGGQDAVVIEKLTDKPKRYDLVVYVRGKEQGVIHRVIHANDDKYIICGDNCWQLEYVKPEQIKGIVTEYCRKGKWHDVGYLPYRLYVRIWVDFLFLKRPIFYVRDKIKRKLKR